jgi:copper chaperone NosL
MRRRTVVAAMLLAVLPLIGCADGPPEVALNLDSCEHCRMTISDPRFAAAATTSGGRTVRFDSIECLANWVNDHPDDWQKLWVTDATAPGTLLPIEGMRFHRGAEGSTPMGKGFAAVAATSAPDAWDGPVLTWTELRSAVASEGLAPQHQHGSR